MQYSRVIMNDLNEVLPGAVIYESDVNGKAITNANNATANEQGYLIINTNPDQYITVKYIGHKPYTEKLKNTPQVIKLISDTSLPPIEVKASRTYYLLGLVGVLILIYSAQKK